MEIKEIKQHPEYDRFLEVKFKEIPDRIFTLNIERLNNLEEVKTKLSKQFNNYFKRKAEEEIVKNYPTKEELKSQINELIGKDLINEI